MVLTFVFNPWFFIAGIPEDFGALETLTEYPRGLRAFTQYVLVPIVAIYLVILTLYLAKVLVTRQWPSGWIGYLVSGVAGVGILSWLLVRPLEERAEHAWVKTFTRGFYIALMPAIVMLWLAIWKRVEQYGITERRYFLIILSLWLAGIAVYYTVSRSRNIKVIPATLCAIAVLGFAGPWSAYSVARASQTRRLASVLERNGLLANGELRPAPAPSAVSDSDATAIRAGLRYLIETHGRRSVDRWIGDRLRTRLSPIRGGNAGAESATVAIMRALNVRPEPSYRGRTGMFSYSVRRQSRSVDIAGYRYAIQLTGSNWRDSIVVTDSIVLRGSADSTALVVTRGATTVLNISLVPLIDSLLSFEGARARQVPERLMTIETRDGRRGALVRLTNLTGMSTRPRRITSVSGAIYLRVP
jgi:hypothetical protein